VGEEAVGIGRNVEFADGRDEGWFEVLGIEGAEIDAYKNRSVCFGFRAFGGWISFSMEWWAGGKVLGGFSGGSYRGALGCG
jgi:hypothetical protein